MATCDGCNKPDPYLRCSRCNCCYYCNKDCQKIHWKKEHKNICNLFAKNIVDIKERDEEAKLISNKLLNPDDYCCICFDALNCDNAMILKCLHMLCKRCIFILPEKELYNDHETISLEASKCPLCRSNQPLHKDLFQDLYNTAVLLVQSANRLNRETHHQERLILCQRARRIMNNVIDYFIDNDLIDTQMYLKFTNITSIFTVELCYAEGNGAEGVELANQLLEKEITEINLMKLYILTAECYILTEDFNKASDILKKTFDVPSMQYDSKSPQMILLLLCRCFYELKDYKRAILAGEQSVELNRHYDGVYKYIALSHRDSGDLESAIKVMKRALAYETPWDEENKERVKLLHDELVSLS